MRYGIIGNCKTAALVHETGKLLGNFPQAYSHMAVINTAKLLGQEPS